MHCFSLNLVSANGESIFYTSRFFSSRCLKMRTLIKKIRFSVVHRCKVTSSSAAVSHQVDCKIWNQFCKSRSCQDFVSWCVCAVDWVSLQRPSHHKLYHIQFSLHLKFYTELIKIGYAHNKCWSHDPFSFRQMCTFSAMKFYCSSQIRKLITGASNIEDWGEQCYDLYYSNTSAISWTKEVKGELWNT